MLKRLLLSSLVLVVAALGLTACGSGENDEDRIVDVIETSATSSDPADCEGLTTIAFMEQTTGGSGDEAVKECEKEAKDTAGDPESIEVSEVEANGSEGTADAKFIGGNLGGQTVAIALVDQGGDWKLDKLVEFVKFNRESLIAAFKEGLGENAEISAALRSCIVEGLQELDDPKLETVVINNEEEVFAQIAEECQQV